MGYKPCKNELTKAEATKNGTRQNLWLLNSFAWRDQQFNIQEQQLCRCKKRPGTRLWYAAIQSTKPSQWIVRRCQKQVTSNLNHPQFMTGCVYSPSSNSVGKWSIYKWRFPKVGVPQNYPNVTILVLKPMVTWGSPIFRKPPNTII
jgi:hypothetical protein